MHHFSFKRLSENVSVSAQITVADIDKIIEAGFATVICHRPDEELSGFSPEMEPHYQILANQLANHNVNVFYQPISQLSLQEVEKFAELSSQLETPILAYCTSGTRSALLWALAQTLINKQPRETVLAATKKAGYDIGHYLN